MKMCFKHKTRIRVDHKIKDIGIMVNCDFWQFCDFCCEFSMFKHGHVFVSFIVICIQLKCCTTSDVHLIMCALCENKQLKELIDQKKKDVFFYSVFFLCFFVNSEFILIHVLIIWLSFMHHIITI
jgi:hypothetical protein